MNCFPININKTPKKEKKVSQIISKSYIILVQDIIFDFSNSNLLPILKEKFNFLEKFYDNKKDYFILPEYISLKDFKNFINYLKFFYLNENLNEIKKENIIKIIELSIYFNDKLIIDDILQKYIYNNLNINTVLETIKNFSNFIFLSENKNKIKDIFLTLMNNCITIIINNYKYFINNYFNEIINLLSYNNSNNTTSIINDIFDEIIELICKENNIIKDNDNIINNLFNIVYTNRNKKNIFELIENERNMSIKDFNTDIENQDKMEELNWKININYKKEEYKVNKIEFEGLLFNIIYYYDSNNDIFSLALQLFKEGNENSKNNYDSETNYDTVKRIINGDSLLDNNNENKIYSILSLGEIDEIKFKSRINFNCIYKSNYNKHLIFKIENFISKFINNNNNIMGIDNNNNNIKFTLKLYLSRNYFFSFLLEYLLKNFHIYYNYKKIYILPKILFLIILNYNKDNSNYKLISILNWIKNKELNDCYNLFEIIDWKEISNKNLIEFLLKYNKILLCNNKIKNDIFYEFQRRFNEEYNINKNNTNTNENDIINTNLDNNNNDINIQNNLNYDNNNNNKDNDINNYGSFTFEILSKIINYCNNIENELNKFKYNYNDINNYKLFNTNTINNNHKYSPINNNNNTTVINSNIFTSPNLINSSRVYCNNYNISNFNNYKGNNIINQKKNCIYKKKDLNKNNNKYQDLFSKNIKINNNMIVNFNNNNNNISIKKSFNTKKLDKNYINKLLFNNKNNRAITPDINIKSINKNLKSINKSIEKKNNTSFKTKDKKIFLNKHFIEPKYLYTLNNNISHNNISINYSNSKKNCFSPLMTSSNKIKTSPSNTKTKEKIKTKNISNNNNYKIFKIKESPIKNIYKKINYSKELIHNKSKSTS